MSDRGPLLSFILGYFSSIYSAKVKPVVDKVFAEKLATASHDENCVSL